MSYLIAIGKNIRVIDPFTIKPLDAATIVSSARATGGQIITVEDHYKEGGCWWLLLLLCFVLFFPVGVYWYTIVLVCPAGTSQRFQSRETWLLNLL